MKKAEAQKIADKTFKSHPKAEKVYVSSDGLAFISKNSAELHKNTNKAKKKISLAEFDNKSFPDNSKSDGDKAKDKGKKNLSEMKAPELKQMAKDLDIQHKAVISNKDLIGLIEAKLAESKNKE